MTPTQFRKVFAIIFLISWSASSYAQYDRPLYAWKSHLPQQIAKQIVDAGEFIFYATPLSIVRITKEDFSSTFYSKIEGLTETGISQIAYDDVREQLVIAYNNGSIDFLQKDGSIVNVADFKLNTTFLDKTVNKIHITDDGKALYATRFGVVAQNLETYFFEFTTNMETEVMEIAQKDNVIYAATIEGIYKLVIETNTIPDDFTQWQFLDGENGLPAIYEAVDIEFHQNKIYAIADDAVYQADNDQFNVLLAASSSVDYVFLSTEGPNLLIGSIDEDATHIDAISPTGAFINSTNSCGNSMLNAIETKDGAIWYADNWHGVRHQENLNGDCNFIVYDSPYSQDVREIRIKNSEPYIASGGVNENLIFGNNKSGFYAERDGRWINYNGNTVPEMKQQNMFNFTVVQPHPSKNIIYAGAFPGGLLEINLEIQESQVFHSGNSPLKGTPSILDLERVIDLQFDENENLWVITYNAEEPLHCYTPEGIWHSFTFGDIRNLQSITFDDFGKMWITLATGNGGILVFDHGGTIADPTDDDFVKFSSGNTEMTTNRVYTVRKDVTGDMWVGTLNGPVVFECGDVFPEKSCRGSIRKVLQDSIPAPLLATEAITTIAVDGANRKWLGSSTGIYVQSPDGETQEFRFTSENSFLFDNSVLDLEYDPVLGYMYIGTVKGVQSIRIDATEASQFFVESEIYTFPNPVRPGYEGPIAIQGLAEDANVKITDMQGRLVYETQAKGGLATWNGFDYSGSKARSGVYLVYATYDKDESNVRTETTKFVIME